MQPLGAFFSTSYTVLSLVESKGKWKWRKAQLVCQTRRTYNLHDPMMKFSVKLFHLFISNINFELGKAFIRTLLFGTRFSNEGRANSTPQGLLSLTPKLFRKSKNQTSSNQVKTGPEILITGARPNTLTPLLQMCNCFSWLTSFYKL